MVAAVPKKTPELVRPIPDGRFPVYWNVYGPEPPVAVRLVDALEYVDPSIALARELLLMVTVKLFVVSE